MRFWVAKDLTSRKPHVQAELLDGPPLFGQTTQSIATTDRHVRETTGAFASLCRSCRSLGLFFLLATTHGRKARNQVSVVIRTVVSGQNDAQ